MELELLLAFVTAVVAALLAYKGLRALHVRRHKTLSVEEVGGIGIVSILIGVVTLIIVIVYFHFH